MSEVNKIANYNQMMSWLTRPATPKTQFASAETDALKEEFNEKLGPGVIKTLDELPPIQDPFKDFEDRNSRETAAEGGVIGKDGMFKGEDMGTREGFGSLKKTGFIRKPFQAKLVEDYHIKYEGQPYSRYKGEVIPEGALRVKPHKIVFTGNIKKALENQKKFYERIVSKDDFVKLRNENSNLTNQEFYDKFMKNKITEQGSLYSYKTTRDNTNKYTNVLEAYPVDYKPRLEAIKEYIDKYNKKNKVNPSVQEITKHFEENPKEFYISNPHINKAKEVYKIKLSEGYKGSGKIKLEKDIKKLLGRKTIMNTLDAGKFPTESQIQTVLKSTRTIAATRQVDLANYLAGEVVAERQSNLKIPKKYKKLAMNAITDLELYKEGRYGPRKKRTRVYNEKKFSKIFGIDEGIQNLRKNILGKIYNLIPELKGLLGVDEIGGLTAGARTNSPYTIFGQVTGKTFNEAVKGGGIDVDKSILERKLINLAKDDPQRLVELEKYNQKVDDFEQMANENNPAKKVKGMKLSFEPPSKAVKNKKVYNQYKDLFDAHYEKYGYSFEVDKDTDSLKDISKKLDNKSFQNEIKNNFKSLVNRPGPRGGKVAIATALATIAGTGFALADDQDTLPPGILPQGSPGQLNPEDKNLLEEYPLTTTAAAAATPLATKTGRKVYGSLAKTLLKGLGSVPVSAYLSGKELMSEDPNYAIAGADLLLPELGKRIPGSGTGIMAKAGRFLTNPIGRLARGFTPVGIGLQGVELVNQAMKEQKRIDNMRENDPEAYQQFIAEQEDMLRESAAYGGRMGFADGPEDPDKRKFMKIMGGLASLPLFGRFFDVATQAPKVAEVVKRSAEGIPDFITDLIAKVKLKAEATGMKYFTGNSSDEFADVYKADDYTVTEQGNKITISKRKESGEMIEKDMEIELEMDPETRSINYKEASARPDAEGKLKDVDEYIDDIDLEDMRRYTYDE